MVDFLTQISPARILVAENDPDDMDRLSAILEDAGYAIERAYYTGDAIFALERGDFSLAVIGADLILQREDSLAEVIAAFPTMRWIALVENGDQPQQFWIELGASDTVQRPYTAKMLLRAVRNTLGVSTTQPVTADDEAGDDQVSTLLKRRLVEQQTLSTLARSLSAELDLDVLLTQVVDAAVSLCNAEEGLLLLPDEQGDAMYIRAVKGIDSETARNFRIRTQDTLAGQVYRTGKPILIGDQGLHKLKTEYLVRSLLYVPLSIKGQPIGVLGINNRHSDRTFGDHDSELLQDLAAHAAIAIENARLYQESIVRARELSTLVQAAEATNSTLALDRVLSIIATQLIGALNVTQCYITEWHPSDRELYPLAIRYRALWKPTAGPVWTISTQPAIGRLLSTRQPVLVDGMAHAADDVIGAWLPHHYHAQSALYVPLYAHERLLGIVTFYRLHKPYSDSDIPETATTTLLRDALEMIVLLVGSDASQQRGNLFQLAQQMLDAAGADWCDIALWNSAKRQFDVTLSYGEVIWHESARPNIDLDQLPRLTQLLHDPYATTNADNEELDYLCSAGYGRSLLALPLTIKEHTAGLVFLVDTISDRTFSRREIELAQALVSQAANALENARLYRDLALSLEELHRTQSKLVQTARLSAMGELAAAVAHQINNPLTTILGDTQLMLQDVRPDDPDYEALEAIFRAGKRAHEVVRRLLTMARQQNTEELPQPLDVNDTIKNTLTLVKSHIQQGHVRLGVDLHEPLPPVSGMHGQLEDVWLNLLLNARDAVAGHPTPTIGIRSHYDAAAQCVEVIVWDNGPGIPPDRQPRVFEPFYTTKPTGEGTGLGLHICRQIVEKCNGSISLQSNYNQGTRFFVHLPVYGK